ncbi:alanine racemase [Tothia fuscella]|uniref:Alanine racemase n=1 Tax=Tothia fuscella TaxID=1048955 RepID=A0A9P4P0R9_9PEZI|nr:alanine racemase [Tothia fuscella]
MSPTRLEEDTKQFRTKPDSNDEVIVRKLLEDLPQSLAWRNSGPASVDFRSDVITRPSMSMLAAIIQTTLNDDVFREDTTTLDFEAEMAERCGMDAAAFTITGTMANQLGLRTLLTQPPRAILTDARAHIVTNEAGGPAFLSGAMMQTVTPRNGKYLTLEDIESNAQITDNVHKCPTRVIALENTISGIVVPLEEMRRISHWARENGGLLHLDGARLFEAVATGAGSLRDYCTLVDTVTIDFSKELGAPMGAMLLGKHSLIAQARRVRKSIGGGMRQSGVLTAACRVGVEEQFGYGEWGSESSNIRAVHRMAKRVGAMWTNRGGELSLPVETNQVWLNLDSVGISQEQWDNIGERHGIRFDGPRLVLHHQINEEALNRLAEAFDDVLSHRR